MRQPYRVYEKPVSIDVGHGQVAIHDRVLVGSASAKSSGKTAMSASKKPDHVERANKLRNDACVVETVTYDDDVTVEAVALLRKKAGEFLSNKTWKVIDGDVDSIKPRLD